MADKIKGITIEIGGDTQKLNKALEGVNKQSRDLQSELKQVERLLKLDPNNTELLAQKQKLLADAVANTKEKLDILKEAERQVAEQFKEGKVGEEQYRAIQREVIATEQQLKKLEAQLKEVNNKWKDAAENLKKFGEKATNVGKEMSLKVTAPIVGAATASMAAWSEVDEALDTIVKKTGLTGEQLEDLQESFRNVAKTMPADMQSIGIAIGEINTRFQVTGQELEDLTKLFIQFAEINETDLNTAIGAAQRIMSQWNIETSRTNEVLGILTNEAQYSGISIETLMDSIQKNGAVLKEMGFSLADSIALLGDFERNGVNAETAMMALRRAVATFAKDGKSTAEGLKETAEAIKNAKTETEALSIATEVFGTRGAAEMVKAIREGRLAFNEFGLSMEEFGGVVAGTFEDTLDPVDNFTVAMNNLKLVGADIATVLQENLAPILEKMVEKLQQLTDWFRNLSPEMQQAILIIGGLAAALGPLLIIIGQISMGLSSLIGLFGGASAAATGATAATSGLSAVISALTGPIGITIAAITAITAVIVGLWKTNDQFRENVKTIWAQIKEIFNVTLNAIKDLITTIFNGIKAFWEAHGETIKKITQTVWDTIGNIINAALAVIKSILDVFIGLITGNWERMSGGLKGIWEGLWNGIKAIIDGACSIIGNIVQLFINIISSKWEGFGGFLQNVWNIVWDTVKTVIDSVLQIIRGIFDVFVGLFTGDWERMGKGIENIWQGMWNGIKAIVEGAWDLLSGAFSSLWQSISNWFGNLIDSAFDWGKNLIDGFIDGIKSMINGVKKAVKSVVNTVADFLGFHSPAKKGEGRFIVDWGSNMIAGFIEGMNKAMPELQKSARSIMPVIKNEIINTTQIDYSKIPKGDIIIHVYNPQPSPAELARQIKKQQQQLALGF